MAVTSDDVLKVNERARLVEGKNGAVIYRPDTAHWMKLNSSGAMIYGLIDGKRSIAGIVGHLCQQYGYPEDIVSEWVAGFMNTLAEKEYLVPATDEFQGRANPQEACVMPQEENRLDVLYLHVTGRCNLSCPYCYASAKREAPELPIELCLKVIKRAAELGATRLAISGGEPMLRKDLPQIIRAGKEAGLVTQLLTNGSLLDSPEIARAITQDLDLLQVSLDGWDNETNRRTRGDGTYELAVNALALLREIGYANTAIAATPYALEEGDIEKIICQAKVLGVRLLRLNQLIPSGRAAMFETSRFSGERAMSLADAAYRHYLDLQQRAAQKGETLSFGVKVAGDPVNAVMSRTPKRFCGVGVSTLSVDSDGLVYPCAALHRSELAVGDVAREDLGTIHERSVERYAQLDVDREEDCRDCDVRHYCGGGCRALQYAFFGKVQGRSPHCSALRERVLETFRRVVA